MKRKYLTLLLAAGMTLTALTGCGANTTSTSQKTTNAAEKETKAAQAQTKAPETKAPETQAPETKTPETKAPETQAPETKAPETQAPETKAPETQAPATEAPETSAPTTEAPETQAPESNNNSGAQSQRIEPLAAAVSMDNLNDCSVAASFSNSDIYEDADGALVIHMTVYDYESFDAAAVSAMQAGDVLVIDGQEVTVSSVNKTDNRIDINGGVDGGGVSLMTDGDGTYYETLGSSADVVYNYQAVGDVTLPVAQEFVYDDQRNQKTYYPGDMLTMADSVDFSCSARDGKVQISGGKIVGVTRIYTP